MADTTDAAQTTNQTTPPVADPSAPAIPSTPPEPTDPAPIPVAFTSPTDDISPTPNADTTDSLMAPSSDSLIVPPPDETKPEPMTADIKSEKTEEPPMESATPLNTKPPKKKMSPAMIITGLILLLITVPLAGLVVKNSTEIRSMAGKNQKGGEVVKLQSNKAQKEYQSALEADQANGTNTAAGTAVGIGLANQAAATAKALNPNATTAPVTGAPIVQPGDLATCINTYHSSSMCTAFQPADTPAPQAGTVTLTGKDAAKSACSTPCGDGDSESCNYCTNHTVSKTIVTNANGSTSTTVVATSGLPGDNSTVTTTYDTLANKTITNTMVDGKPVVQDTLPASDLTNPTNTPNPNIGKTCVIFGVAPAGVLTNSQCGAGAACNGLTNKCEQTSTTASTPISSTLCANQNVYTAPDSCATAGNIQTISGTGKCSGQKIYGYTGCSSSCNADPNVPGLFSLSCSGGNAPAGSPPNANCVNQNVYTAPDICASAGNIQSVSGTGKCAGQKVYGFTGCTSNCNADPNVPGLYSLSCSGGSASTATPLTLTSSLCATDHQSANTYTSEAKACGNGAAGAVMVCGSSGWTCSETGAIPAGSTYCNAVNCPWGCSSLSAGGGSCTAPPASLPDVTTLGSCSSTGPATCNSNGHLTQCLGGTSYDFGSACGAQNTDKSTCNLDPNCPSGTHASCYGTQSTCVPNDLNAPVCASGKPCPTGWSCTGAPFGQPGTSFEGKYCVSSGSGPATYTPPSSSHNNPGNSGESGNSGAPACVSIVVYDTSYNVLSATDLGNLHPGDTVILGYAPGGEATEASFSINSGDWQDTTNRNPSNNAQFILQYKLDNSSSFDIVAEWFDGTNWNE